MPLILADLPTPSDASVGSWIAVYAGLCIAVYYTQAIVKSMRARPAKVEGTMTVESHSGNATRLELEKMDKEAHGRMNRERKEIDAEIARVEDRAQRRLDLLEAKIDENTKLTSVMSGQLGQMNQNISVLTSAVTNFMRDQAR